MANNTGANVHPCRTPRRMPTVPLKPELRIWWSHWSCNFFITCTIFLLAPIHTRAFRKASLDSTKGRWHVNGQMRATRCQRNGVLFRVDIAFTLSQIISNFAVVQQRTQTVEICAELALPHPRICFQNLSKALPCNILNSERTKAIRPTERFVRFGNESKMTVCPQFRNPALTVDACREIARQNLSNDQYVRAGDPSSRWCMCNGNRFPNLVSSERRTHLSRSDQISTCIRRLIRMEILPKLSQEKFWKIAAYFQVFSLCT